MKKIILLTGACCVVLAMSSCRKTRICTCTYTAASGTTGSYTETYLLSKKKDAQAYCDAETSIYATCELN